MDKGLGVVFIALFSEILPVEKAYDPESAFS